MSILSEFKAFAVKGNVIDLAVAVIIGAAFGKIVSSLVGDVVMPMLGAVLGGVNFSDLKWVIHSVADQKVEVAIAYGKFLQAVFDFLLISFSVFMFIRILNNVKNKLTDEVASPSPDVTPLALSKDQELLTEIRDLLQRK